MKKFTLTLLAVFGFLLFMTTNSNAGVHVGVYVGAPGPYYVEPVYPAYYGPYYGGVYYPRYYHGRHYYGHYGRYGHHWH